jgi:hypothetical protein
MPAMLEEADCWGFAAPKLVVYAFRVESEFYTGIRTRTRFVRYASEDIKELGPDRDP